MRRSRGPWPWPVAAGALIASATAGRVLLSPRSGLMEPDPVDGAELFEPADVARARAYRRVGLMLGVASGAVQAATLMALARRPPPPRRRLGRLRARRRRRPAEIAARDAASGAGLAAALTLMTLPFDVVSQRRALRVGLATETWPDWGRDLLKSSAIGFTLTGAASAGLLALVRRSPRGWWLAASGAGLAAGTTFALLAPVALDPVFNRFEPLAEGSLRDGVFELAGRAGVRVREVYEIDASRRTTAVNAYVTGLGPTKRVVLYDTLLSRFTEEEARVVVAHELAHVRHRDVPRGLAYLGIVAPFALRLAADLAGRLRPLPEDPDLGTLAALTLALGAAGAVVGVSSGALSRRLEVRADVFSLRMTDAPEAFISFEQKIVTQNLADPDPPRWLVALGASHPSAVARIGVARAYARLAGAAQASGSAGPG